ncbi:Protein mmf1, mitochondrial [Hondaea fermentalgiana]|uniref:Protein mmf1, mitochondrial n=1 Tax=Hondaea fermentalgiana TaxID=2315210 RepID=A0A2R5FZE4_9STRA|nr:Protein mmf1, mitochondrial [Hondaea fermentalgiana]|eukprot:GBG24122.1 Protein mmf1, mitochondrial [Hondaea fermentalgiana]
MSANSSSTPSSSSSSSAMDWATHPFTLGLATAAAFGAIGFALGRGSGARKAQGAVNQSIRRWRDSPRACASLEHNGVVYLSGQVGDIDKLETSDAAEQTRQTLKKIDDLLAEAGTNKKNILSAQIWVKDITQHFEPMNQVWNEWVDTPNKGVRACVEAHMARPGLLVEIKIIAAMP